MKKVYRSRKNQILGGVCAGLAKYFDIDPIILRLVAVALIFAGGAAIIAYIIAWIIIPEEPRERGKAGEEETQDVVLDVEQEKENSESRKNKNLELLAWVLVVIGIIWAARYAFTWWLPTLHLGGRVFTPVVLIILGVVILLWKKR
ncbi:MAG TPA: PspC domain-containing protein [Atribacteraceae bacterium]|nr:PspC domain-containing protein [Atribacteraceae bacterium]